MAAPARADWPAIRLLARPAIRVPAGRLAGERARGVADTRLLATTRRRPWTERLHLSPAWPLQLLLVGFPLWWVLGLNTFIFPIAAVPMIVALIRKGRIKYPPFFWLWVLFQVWQVLGLALVGLSPPGTHPGSLSGRVLSIAVNLVEYVGITATLLYLTNLPTSVVSQAKVARWLGWFFLTVAAGGFLGLFLPHLQFTSALEYVLPSGLSSNTYVHVLVHPMTAQVQDLISDTGNPRPSAPFGYTNSWGYAISVLGVWFVAGWVLPAAGRRRWLYLALVAVTLVPVILSLNRGLWIGVIFTIVWVLVREYLQGNVGRVLAIVSAAAAAVAGALLLTPAGSIIQARLNAGDSNQIRAFVAQQSLDAAPHSPIVGYGGNRHTNGSATSIAIGKTASCPHCGDVSTGSTGQLWTVMFNQGVLGTVIYLGYFLATLWVFRRERDRYSQAALITTALVFVYMFVYLATPVAPTLTVIGIGMLARQRHSRAAADSAAAGA